MTISSIPVGLERARLHPLQPCGKKATDLAAEDNADNDPRARPRQAAHGRSEEPQPIHTPTISCPSFRDGRADPETRRCYPDCPAMPASLWR